MKLWWCENAVVGKVVGNAIARHVTVAAEDGRVISVEADTVAPAGATRLRGLTIPGVANTHSHAFHRALRGRTQVGGGTFWTWREVMYRAASALNPDSYHRLARAVFAEMVCSGISCVGEFHYLHHGPGGVRYSNPNAMGEALASAAAEVGIRLTLLDTLYLHGGLEPSGYQSPSPAQMQFSDGSAHAWAERVDEIPRSSHLRVGAAIHSVRAVDPVSMKTVVGWAKSAGAPVHAHVSEQVGENQQCWEHHRQTPMEVLHDAGVLGASFTAVHATHLTERDVELLGQSGSGVCLCPTTERDLGDGIGPGITLAEANVPVSLGSDSHAIIDPLVEMRSLELGDRLASQRRGHHTAQALLDMATNVGHRALGWDDAGTLREGHRVDLTTIDLESIRTAGGDPDQAIETAVFAATASDISTVIVDGETIVENGSHVSIDTASELSRCIEELFR